MLEVPDDNDDVVLFLRRPVSPVFMRQKRGPFPVRVEGAPDYGESRLWVIMQGYVQGLAKLNNRGAFSSAAPCRLVARSGRGRG